MDLNPEKYPILHYIITQQNSNSQTEPEASLRMPHLTHPEVIKSMASSVSDIIQSQSFMRSLGDRPASDVVATAKAKIAEVESKAGNCEEMEKELQVYKAVMRLDQMHQEYDKKLKSGEDSLADVYRKLVDDLGLNKSDVAEILENIAKGESLKRIEIPGRRLRVFPEGFAKIYSLVVLNLSNNLLQVLPDSIAELKKLEVLNVASNLLETLPDSIEMLISLKILDVSGNKLNYLPESISDCSNLEELNSSCNNLTCLPMNIGYGLKSLKKLSIYLNKITFLPPSLCEIESLEYLDAHFNELGCLPNQIGKLVNLKVLNVSSNFSDLTEIPNSICNLINLKELDLSNNQIGYLPDEFFRLEKLEKLNVNENPLIIPPLEVAIEGVVVLRDYMSKRWEEILVEDHKSRYFGAKKLTHGGSRWLGNIVKGYVRDRKRYRDPWLDQQL